jgi:hypothetical protein
MEEMENTGYELANLLPREKKKEPPETVKITMTVPKEDVEAIDKAVKLCGLAGDTPTAYGRAAFSIAAERARELLGIREGEDDDEH